jgi:hypothetical protein
MAPLIKMANVIIIYLPTTTYLPTHPPTYLLTTLTYQLPTHLSTYLLIITYLLQPTYPPTYLCTSWSCSDVSK